MRQLKGKYLIIVIALSSMICGGPGLLINSAGVYFNPIAEELGIGRGTVSFAQTLANIGFALGSLLAARILKPQNFRRLIAVALVVYACATASLALAGSLPALYAINCVRGLSAGLVGMVMITTTLNNWFYGSAGFVTSIVMGSCGIMAALFSPLLTRAIAAFGWRNAYVVNACLIVLLFLPALLLRITYTPEEIGLRALGSPAEDISPAEAENPAQIGGKGPSEGMGGGGFSPARPAAAGYAAGSIDRGVFALSIFIALLSATVMSYPSHFPGVASTRGLGTAVGAAMISVTMAMNTLGKLVFGILTDRIGNRKSMMIWFGAVIAGALLMIASRSAVLLYISAGAIGLGYTFTSLSNIILCKDLFGVKNYNRVYPKMSLASTLANATFTSLVGFIYDATKSYAPAFLLLACVLAFTTFLALTAYRRAGVE